MRPPGQLVGGRGPHAVVSYDPHHLGERSVPQVHEVEKGAIRRFAEALGETDPVYFDENEAARRGYSGLLAPPTFAATLRPRPVPGLTLPQAGLIHGEQEYVYGKPICAGDTITVTAWLEDVRVRRGSRSLLTLVTVASEGVHPDGVMAFQARSVLIVPEGVT